MLLLSPARSQHTPTTCWFCNWLVVVLLNGGSLSIADLQQSAPAIIEAFFPGTHTQRTRQRNGRDKDTLPPPSSHNIAGYQGGVAIADVIFGGVFLAWLCCLSFYIYLTSHSTLQPTTIEYNPGGKLPVTIYQVHWCTVYTVCTLAAVGDITPLTSPSCYPSVL
jgi:hypothetical protein